jgi:hypothetical protein
VYKTAARNLSRRRRPSRSVKIAPPVAKSRAQLRMFWFPVIRHHAEANISVADKYGRKFPSWLEAEVDRFTPERWLGYWDKASGKPKAK